MKCFKSLLVVLLLVFSMSFIGCEGCNKQIKHFKSGTIGLKRKVTLYNCNGGIIKEWQGRFLVEMNGDAAAFIDDGKEIKVSGTYIIEEL